MTTNKYQHIQPFNPSNFTHNSEYSSSLIEIRHQHSKDIPIYTLSYWHCQPQIQFNRQLTWTGKYLPLLYCFSVHNDLPPMASDKYFPSANSWPTQQAVHATNWTHNYYLWHIEGLAEKERLIEKESERDKVVAQVGQLMHSDHSPLLVSFALPLTIRVQE